MPISRSEAVQLQALLESDGWAVLAREYAQDLERKRAVLEAPSLNHDATQTLRGEIAAYKILLALPAHLISTAPPDEDEDQPLRKSIKDYRK